jgi:hypothetical protein
VLTRRRAGRWLALLPMITSLFLVLPQPQVAHADAVIGQHVWSENVKDVGASELITHPNGSVTVANCDSRSKTFNSLGMLEGQATPAANHHFCDQLKAADGSGTVYGTRYNPNTGVTSVIAFRHGTKLWDRALKPCNVAVEPKQIVLGADGYLHVLTNQEYVCDQQRTHIAKLNLSDGSGALKAIVNRQVEGIAAYQGGLITYNSSRIDYLTYGGTWLPSVPVTDSTLAAFPEGSTMNGKIFFQVIREPRSGEDDCGDDSERSRSIVGYGPSGRVFSYDVPGCSEITDTAVRPDGGVSITAKSGVTYWGASLNLSGAIIGERHDLPLGENDQFGELGFRTAGTLAADVDGNLLLSRWYEFRPEGGQRQTGTKYSVLDPQTFAEKATFYTSQIDAKATFWPNSEAEGLAQGTLYFAASKCDGDDWCYAQRLYAVSLPVNIDYPRGKTLEGISGSSPLVCPALLFLGVRGSGETADQNDGYGSTVNDVKSRLSQAIPTMATKSIDYTAIPILYGGLTAYGAEYSQSVNVGKTTLKEYVNFVADKCSSTRFVGVGYSQGAHVVGDAFSELPSTVQDRVAAMVLFGDPRFNPSQTIVNDGTYDSNLSGIYKTQAMRQVPSILEGQTRSYCIQGDPICNFTLGSLNACRDAPSTCPHARYTTLITSAAVEWISSVLD